MEKDEPKIVNIPGSVEIPQWKIDEMMRDERYSRLVAEKEMLYEENIEDDEFTQITLVANLD